MAEILKFLNCWEISNFQLLNKMLEASKMQSNVVKLFNYIFLKYVNKILFWNVIECRNKYWLTL